MAYRLIECLRAAEVVSSVPRSSQSAGRAVPARCLAQSAFIFLAILVAWPSASVSRTAHTTEIRLQETPEGQWLVEFRFPEPQRALVFRQSPEPYRADTWTSLTEGVEIETVGRTDVMIFDTPGQEAVFEIQPYTESLEKAYTPFLSFTDGSWGVLEGRFRLSAAGDREAVETFDGNGETWPGEPLDYTLAVDSQRRIFHGGAWVQGALTLEPQGDGTYVYVGDADIQFGDNFVGFVDRGLPAWIREQLDDDLARIFSELSAEWASTLAEPVEVLFVFDGAENPGLLQTGGALGRQLALQVSGEALLEPDRSIIDYFRWFLTHESVHVFQTAAGMQGTSSEHAWMQEGVANTMAHRIVGRLAGDREAFLREAYGEAFANCVGYLETGAPLSAAIETGQFGVYYSCGDFVALLTEARLAEGDIFDFWKRFLSESSASGDDEISIDRYFELASEAGLTEEEVGQLRAFVGAPVPEPRQTLIRLLESAALEPRFDKDGKLESLALPR